MKPHLYCMMEVGTREFLARCLTACVAAERGFTVLLGHQHTLMEHSPVLPQGIYYSKGTNAIATTNMGEALRHGHLTVACEEENFFRVLSDNPLDVTDQTLPEVCTLFLAMGEEEETHLRTRFGDRIEIERCGNARTDILRPDLRIMFEEDAATLRNRFGHFILINSNLGIINSALPQSAPKDIFRNWIDANVFREDLDIQKRGEIFQDFIHFDESNALALRGVLSELAHRDHKVLFRPHPGEKRSTWDAIVAGLNAPNIQVMDEGSHIPAILASDLLVHSSCTTGVEALLAGKPSLSVNTDKARAHSYYLSNQFNVRSTSPADSIEMIDRHLGGDPFIQEARPDLIKGLSRYVDALDEGPLAAENIVDAIEAVYRERFGSGSVPVPEQSQPREVRILREYADYTKYEYIRQKLGISKALVENTLATYQRILGRFNDVSCLQISDSVFMFSA